MAIARRPWARATACSRLRLVKPALRLHDVLDLAFAILRDLCVGERLMAARFAQQFSIPLPTVLGDGAAGQRGLHGATRFHPMRAIAEAAPRRQSADFVEDFIHA